MPTQTRYVSALEQRYRRLCQQAERLVADRSILLARERLLSAWCSGLQLFKEYNAEQDVDEDVWRHCQELERLLQQELSQMPQISVAELLPMDWHGQHGTIAPASDPFAHFRRLLSQPVLPAAATMSSQALAQLRSASTTEAALQQQLLQITPVEQHGRILHRMQLIWERYYHAALSLHLLGRSHVLEGISVYNLETLQPDPQGFADSEQVIINRIHHAMHLTPQQQEAICVGLELYEAHMARILAKQQQAQLSQTGVTAGAAAAAAAAAAPSSVGSLPCPHHTSNGDSTPCNHGCQQGRNSRSSAGAGAGSSSSRSSSSDGTGGGPGVFPGESTKTLLGRLQQLQPTQDKVVMWQALLHQEGQLRMASLGWLLGCLSWTQVTTLAVLCWPFPMRPLVFARAVSEQQQQQQAQPQPPQRQRQRRQRQRRQQQQVGTDAPHAQ